MALTHFLAEFRGPGVHHNFDDSDSGYDVNLEQSNRAFSSNQSGRIILLGDGSEVLTDSDDTEMFDHDEDKDLASQVHKGQTASEKPVSTDSAKIDALPEKIPDEHYKGVVDSVLPQSSKQ